MRHRDGGGASLSDPFAAAWNLDELRLQTPGAEPSAGVVRHVAGAVLSEILAVDDVAAQWADSEESIAQWRERAASPPVFDLPKQRRERLRSWARGAGVERTPATPCSSRWHLAPWLSSQYQSVLGSAEDLQVAGRPAGGWSFVLCSSQSRSVRISANRVLPSRPCSTNTNRLSVRSSSSHQPVSATDLCSSV